MNNTIPQIPDFQVCRVGSAPVIRKLIDEMGLIDRIDQLSPVKKEACNVSVGTRIAAIMINQLTSRKLDALHNAGLQEVYIQAIQSIQGAVTDLSWDRLHFDTTSMVYTGQAKDEENLLKIVRGYSKDHRHDLPQIKIGMGTNAQGIPIYGEALDGNQDDKKWNGHFLKALTDWFSPETLTNAIFIADSAFVTKDNLKELKRENEPDLLFLSRLPENFKLAGELKEKVWKQEKWEEVGTLSSFFGMVSIILAISFLSISSSF